MPVLDTTLKRINKYVGKNLTLEELDELLFRFGFELDSAKKVDDDYELKIEVTPDRPDCLSTIGLARTLRMYLGDAKPRQYSLKRGSGLIIKVDASVSKIRPYIGAVVVKGVNLTEEDLQELIWTQEKLHATFCRDRRKASIGFYPLAKITWPLKYYAEDPNKIRFRPLGYDYEMTAKQILTEHPTGIKYASILEGHDKYPLFTDANGNVLSMPPIINSVDFGQITPQDKDILVETTGTHKETMLKTLNIIATILADLGGELYEVKIEYPENTETTPNFQEEKWQVRLVDIEKTLGIKISKKKVKQLLERMGYIVNTQGSYIEVEVPPYRTDIFHRIDIIDDVARAYGFDNFEPELTPVFTTGATFEDIRIVDFIRDALVGLGYNEVFTFALTSMEDQFNKFGLDIPKDLVMIEGAKETKLNIVRYWLLPELVKTLAENKAVEYPIKIFEIGDVVKLCDKLQARACNYKRLAILLASTSADYTQIRAAIEYVLDILNKQYTIERDNHPAFIEGRTARIVIDGENIGIMGELHPQVIVNYGLNIPIAAAEIDLTKLLKIEVKEVEWA